VTVKVAATLFGRLKLPAVAKPALGGLAFGLVGVALPLTMFTGSDQLKTVVKDAGTLGVGLVAVMVIAKTFVFAVSQESGFVGGPIFPTLFIGGTAGVLVHLVVPGVPEALALTCLFAAVPGAVVAAPFSMVLMAAFMTQVGALQTAPILIAVLTAFLTMEGVKYLIACRKQASSAAVTQTAAPSGHSARA
jgi:H+/Cl- antiporter ClcA